ncbi:MAG: type II secretion system minor pseudopilin GspK [Pseudomonadota bacterium]
MLEAREEGTVLLSTLLVLSLMSAVALALLSTLRLSVARAAELDAIAQADLYAQGAQDFVQSQLDQIAGTDPVLLNARLRESEVVLLPFENGQIALTLSDGTHCLRLSALSGSNGVGLSAGELRLAALVEAVGADAIRARRVAAAATDWVDRDGQPRPDGAEDGAYMARRPVAYRTANVPMQSVTELRAVEGMDETLFRELLPHVCIGRPGVTSRFNINSAQARHAPVLAALLGGGRDAERIATELIAARPADGYSKESLAVAPVLEGYENAAFDPGAITFSPQRVVAEVAVRFGPVERLRLLAYETQDGEGLDSGRPVLSYRSWGPEEFPSLAWARRAKAADPAADPATDPRETRSP